MSRIEISNCILLIYIDLRVLGEKDTYRLAIHLRDHAVLVELSLFLEDGLGVDRLCGQAVETLDFG